MQVVASPTRSDVDEAHQRSEWSAFTEKLRRLPRALTLPGATLVFPASETAGSALSNLGVHSYWSDWPLLLSHFTCCKLSSVIFSTHACSVLNYEGICRWNSMIFYTPSTYLYYLIGVNKDFEIGNGHTPREFYVDNMSNPNATVGEELLYPGDLHQIQNDIHNSSLFEELSPYDCINAYAQRNIYNRSDLVIVTEPTTDYKRMNETCPMAQGHPYQAPNGDWFTFSCYTDTVNGYADLCGINDLQCTSQASLTACVDRCAATSNCTGATWEPSGGKLCILKSDVSDLHHIYTHMAMRMTEPPSVSTNSSVLWTNMWGGGTTPFRWMCPNDDGVDKSLSSNACRQSAQDRASNWTIDAFVKPRALRCYSKLMPQRCKLQFSVFIGSIVTGFNFIKFGLFTLTFLMLRKRTRVYDDSNDSNNANELNDLNNSKRLRYDPVLITTGDAIASFLQKPDCNTENMCLAEKLDFENGIWDARWVQLCPIRWRRNYHRSWFRVIGMRRWITGGVLQVANIPADGSGANVG